jgi:Tissue inhibitor of metalloproteinase
VRKSVSRRKRLPHVDVQSMLKGVTLAALALLGVRGVLGCSCAGPIPVCSVYWNTDTLFLGHVVSIEHVYDQPPRENSIGPGQNLVHFDVTKVYRGARSSEEVVIHTADQGSACGYAFEQGHDYLVYASAQPNGELNTSHCTRTHEVASPKDDADIQWMEGLARSPAGGSIFGQIRMLRQNQDGGYDSSAIARVAVSIKGPESKTMQSDGEGKFHVDGLDPGKYVVSAKAPNQYAPFGDQTVTIQNRACAEVDWSTSLDGHIRGHVYFSDGKPAPGLFLHTKAADAVRSEPWTWKQSLTTTGSDGAFDFAPVSPGTYIFGVNMDFSSVDGKGYYRKALYPGTSNRAEAATVTLGAGETVDNLNFYLPPDSPAPSIPVQVQVLGFDGMPVAHAEILAADDMWENSPTPLMATADENGKATVTLRPGSHYDIEAIENLPDFTQACAEPQAVEARGEPGPVVLKLSHPFGNCMPFKK